jgi:hypothetical protein
VLVCGCSAEGGIMKVFWLAVSIIGLVGCVTEGESKKVIITPTIYKQASFLCAKEKGLIWISVNPENTAELEVLCHSENVFKIKLAR